MSRPARGAGVRITSILVSMVVGVVAVILLLCIALFLDRYPPRHCAERPHQQRAGGFAGVPTRWKTI